MIPNPLSPENAVQFQENGFLVVEDLITEPQVEELIAGYEKAIAGEYGDMRWKGKRVDGRMIQLANPSRVIPGWSDHAYMANGLAIARQLLGEDLAYHYDQMIMKPPQYPAETHWHQDAGYWHNDRALTCWLALSPVFEANGAMHFIPGSHKKGIVEHQDASGYSEINSALEAVMEDDSAAVAIPLNPGSATFHHCKTLHYAGGNHSDIPRRGLITHFFPKTDLP